MLEFLTANIWWILIAAVGGVVLLAVMFSNTPLEYPFDEPGYIHIGLTSAQLKLLAPITAELPFMETAPKHSDKSAVYHALTETEFLKFYGALVNHWRVVIAEQARIKAAFLPPEILTISELVVSLRPVKDRISPEPLDSEIRQFMGNPTALESGIGSE